jgi:predicted metal-dependent hydrolase
MTVQLDLPFASTSVSTVAPIGDSILAPTSVEEIVPAHGSSIAPTTDSWIAPIYFVRHRRARRYLLRVEPDGRVRVTIPRGGSRREADAFVLRHADWVARQRASLTASAFGLDERRALRERARTELPARLSAIAAEQGMSVTGVSIRNQRTRWGSCGRDGHISLNWRLVLMPPAVRDYVLIHELMHLRRLDHSPAFWKLVAAACPSYREARQWLRQNGPALR